MKLFLSWRQVSPAKATAAEPKVSADMTKMKVSETIKAVSIKEPLPDVNAVSKNEVGKVEPLSAEVTSIFSSN